MLTESQNAAPKITDISTFVLTYYFHIIVSNLIPTLWDRDDYFLFTEEDMCSDFSEVPELGSCRAGISPGLLCWPLLQASSPGLQLGPPSEPQAQVMVKQSHFFIQFPASVECGMCSHHT